VWPLRFFRSAITSLTSASPKAALLFEKTEQQQTVARGVEAARNAAVKRVQRSKGVLIESRRALPGSHGAQAGSM